MTLGLALRSPKIADQTRAASAILAHLGRFAVAADFEERLAALEAKAAAKPPLRVAPQTQNGVAS